MTADIMPLAPMRHDTAGQQVAQRPAESGCWLVEWKPWRSASSSLIGHCSVAFSGGWIVHQIPIFRSGDGLMSVGVPTAAQLDADGRVRLKDGKRLYTPVLGFATAEGRERWQRMVLGALAAGGIGVAP